MILEYCVVMKEHVKIGGIFLSKREIPGRSISDWFILTQLFCCCWIIFETLFSTLTSHIRMLQCAGCTVIDLSVSSKTFFVFFRLIGVVIRGYYSGI